MHYHIPNGTQNGQTATHVHRLVAVLYTRTIVNYKRQTSDR